MNVKLIISYDGSKFNGSAIQPHTHTVQGSLEKALKILGIESKTNFSGRTDKDVHATYQVVSFEVPDYWNDLNRLKNKLSNLIDDYIHIKSIEAVDDSFHARFSATKREYRYILSTKPLTPFKKSYLHYHPNLDLELLKGATKELIGRFDFEYFSKTGSDPKSTIREIYNITVYKYKTFIIIKFCANAYLRSQIRMIVDFLLKISDKKLTIEDLQNQLNKKGQVSKTLAPACGLYLSKIVY
jgi:tRNA pseudouridine38-40 synthase